MRSNILVYLVLLAVVDVVMPVPILAVVLIYVVWKKPRWFPELVREVYEEA